MTTTAFGWSSELVEQRGLPAEAAPLQCELAPDISALRLVRQRLRGEFGHLLPAGVLDDLELVVIELLANAFDASEPTHLTSLSVRLSGSDVLVEVTDQSIGTPALRRPDELAEAGRALVLVAALSRDWGWRPSRPGKTVWALLSNGRAPIAPEAAALPST